MLIGCAIGASQSAEANRASGTVFGSGGLAPSAAAGSPGTVSSAAGSSGTSAGSGTANAGVPGTGGMPNVGSGGAAATSPGSGGTDPGAAGAAVSSPGSGGASTAGVARTVELIGPGTARCGATNATHGDGFVCVLDYPSTSGGGLGVALCDVHGIDVSTWPQLAMLETTSNLSSTAKSPISSCNAGASVTTVSWTLGSGSIPAGTSVLFDDAADVSVARVDNQPPIARVQGAGPRLLSAAPRGVREYGAHLRE